MLSALSPEESAFYAQEENVLDLAGKSSAQFEELEQHYGFLGGSYDQYIAYLNRSDLPSSMWQFIEQHEVKSIAGFSAVVKKNRRQRKLLMQCASNYLFSDVTKRSELGMMGGAALADLHVPGDSLSLASWDESNAFSFVRTPAWMWPWCCSPAVRARDVWTLLAAPLQAKLNGADWVFPAYTRLAMGSSHSVHIL